jgi:lipopolysaccharide transport system ATP-binding protein
MSDIAIRVEGLGKQYRIGTRKASYGSLRDSLTEAVAGPFKRFRKNGDGSSPSALTTLPRDTIWALRDVSFEVKRGEVIGIIGRNGAGKSTLLKILSRVTEPTNGEVDLFGRVGSLLEVGTGFHPELTGRENIYLNGSILGLKRAEIRSRFDEIVAFAEIERFVDTPVKRYSSGMYVRLAFAVAAHMETEILLIDEVLAVGDTVFQKKCLGKINEVAKEGRTVLFISHNMAALTRLCQRGLVLDAGAAVLDSNIFEATSCYLHSDVGTSAERFWNNVEHAPGNAIAKLRSVRVLSDGVASNTIDIRRPVTIEMEYWNFKPNAKLIEVFSFIDEQGIIAFVSADFEDLKWDAKPKTAGLFRARCTVPGNLFAEGQLRVVAEVSTGEPYYEIHFLEFDSVSFQVIDTGGSGSVRSGWGRPIPGVVRPMLQWQREYLGFTQRSTSAD